MNRRSSLLGVLLAAALAWPEGSADARVPEKASPREASPADRITPALEARIDGRTGLGDVQVDVFWSRGGKATTARVFGDGVGIWQKEAQFELPRARVLEILEAIRKARFGSMPDQFGEDEESEKDKGPRLRGQLVVRAGSARKTTIQLVNGDQSKAFARLLEKILRICEGPARQGVRAPSMSEALRLLAAGKLSPHVLEAAVQRRPDPKGSGGCRSRAGRCDWQGSTPAKSAWRRESAPDPAQTLVLSAQEFHDLAVLLSDSDPSALPQSLFADAYTDFSIEILQYSRTVAGRRYLGMTAATHGDKQKAFDRIIGAFEALRRRIENGGEPPAPPVTARARPGG